VRIKHNSRTPSRGQRLLASDSVTVTGRSPLSQEQIQQRVNELGPWVHAFEFDGVRYFDSVDRPSGIFPKPIIRERRTEQFWDVFPQARRVMELGALEGADTIHLAARPGIEVIAVEGRPENLRRARFVVELHRLDNVRFVEADLETFDLSVQGSFDAVVCSGILYHLSRPWELLHALGRITSNVFLWTHYWGDDSDSVEECGYRVHEVREEFPEPRLRGLRPMSRWFCRQSIFQAIADSGFTEAQTLAEAGTGPIREITLALRR
jgi:SAM-dependent methyltransferase